MPNTNNPIELLVSITADTDGSKASLNKQLDKLSKELDGLQNVSLGINKEDIKALKDIANIDFSKLKDSVSKPIQDGVEVASKEIKQLTRMTEDEFKKAAKAASEAIGVEFGKIGKIDSVADISKELKAIDPSAIIQVTKEVTKAGEEVRGLTASFKQAGIERKIAFEQVRVGTGNTGETEVIGWSPKLIKEVDANLKDATNSASLFVAKVDKLQQTGKITNLQFEELTSNIGKIGNADGGLQKLNTQADNFVASNKRIKSEQEKQTKELRTQEQLQEKIRKLTNTIITEQKRNPKGLGGSPEVSGMLDTLKGIDPASKGAAASVKGVSDGFDEMRAKATLAGRSSLSTLDSFKIAMEKFPIWMAASTAFYSTVRSINSAITQVIALDSQTTVLKRVAGDGVDVNLVLRDSVKLAGELGNLISDVNDGFIAFARQGFRGAELNMMTEYATLLGNISDMSVDESASTLTAALKGFNMEAETGIHVVNALNEVDNNFAITTQQLSQAMTRSAGAASVYGVSLERTIGYTTAIGQVTRESGSVIGNSLKSIYSRLTSVPKAVSAMADIGISIKDSAGEMRKIDDILDDLGGQWGSLNAEQQQNLGLQIAGRFQLSRFLILMNQYKEAMSATETATSSAGSGYRENAEYLKSYEAQINMVKNAWTESVLAMKDSGLGDGMIVGLNVGLEFFKVMTSVIEKVGLLPALLGGAGLAFLLFSKHAGTATTITNGFAISALGRIPVVGGSVVSSLSSMSIGMQRFAAGTGIAATSVGVLRSALGMILPIAAIMAVGAALSFITSKVSDHIEKQKELNQKFDEYKQKNLDAASTNKKQVDELISSYEKLGRARDDGNWSNKKEEEYLSIQEQLGELFPSLIDHIDDKGTKHLKTSEEILKEVQANKELYKAEQLLKLSKSEDDYKEKIKLIEEYTNKVKAAEAIISSSIAARTRNGASTETILNENMQAESDKLVYASLGQQASKSFNSAFTDDLKIEMGALGAEISPSLQKSIDEALMSINFKGIDEKQATSFRSQIASLGKEMGEAFNSGDSKRFEELSDSFTYLLIAMGSTETEARKLVPTINDLQQSEDNLAKSIAEGKNVTEEGAESLSEFAEEADKAKNAIDSMSGTTQKHIDETNDLMWQYDLLTSQLDLLSVGTADYNSVNSQLQDTAQGLLALYPQLSSESLQLIDRYEELSQGTYAAVASSDELSNTITRLIQLHPELENAEISRINMIQSVIKNIAAEKEANDVLRKAMGALSNGKLTAEETMTLVQLENTNARIRNINTEIEAMQKIANAYASVYEDVKAAALAGDEGAGRALMRISVPIGKMQMLTAELASATATRGQYIDVLKESENVMGKSSDAKDKNAKASKNQTKAEKEAAKALEQSVFLADKYKRALELLNLEIQKQQDIQSKFPNYSSQFRTALESEIKLQKDKTNLLQQQSKALESQIKAGKILQTGVVTTTQSSGGSQKLSGWSGAITSQFGNRTAPKTGASTDHQGIDIAGKNGTRVDSNVSGVVTFAGNKGDGLGNYVAIKDASGNTNIYGHLQDVLVKAGQSIAQGVKLGTIGSSGTSTGNHLHYQVNDSSGKAINPASQVDAARKGISDASKEVAQVQSQVDSAQSEVISLNGQIINQQALIAKLEMDLVSADLSQYEQRRESYDRVLGFEAEKLKTLDINSQRYGDTLERMGAILVNKQKANQDEMKYLDNLIKNGNFSAVVMNEMKIRAELLKTEMLSLDEVISKNNFDIIGVSMKRYEETMDDLNHTLELSKLIMGTLEEGSHDYQKELGNQITLLERERQATKAHKEELEKKIKTVKLGTQEYKELAKEIKVLTLSYWTLEGAIREATGRIADDVISTFKRSYEMQRDIASKQKDEQIRYLDEVHDVRMKQYDEDLRRFEEIVHEKIRLIDDQDNEDQYNKELAKLQTSQLELQNRITNLSLSNSLVDQAKRVELETELAKLIEQIEDKKNGRTKELRKKGLNDQLDTFKKETDAKKKSEDTSYNFNKERLEKEKRDIEYHYNELINNEMYWATMRKNIMDGNIDSAKKGIEGFLASFKSMNQQTIEGLTMSWTSLLNLIAAATGSLGNIGSIGNIGSGGDTQTKSDEKRKDWAHYLDNKYESEKTNPPQARKDLLRERNNTLRSRWGFPDGTWDSLKNYPMTFHEGGIVGGSSDKTVQSMNKLFNTKMNETMIKAEIGELLIPKKNLIGSFLPNMQSLLKTIVPSPPMLLNTGGTNYTLSPIINVTVAGNSKNIGQDIANQTFKVMDGIMRNFGK